MNRRFVSFAAVLVACLALLALVAPAAAAAKRWELLGTRTVTDRLDHDSIVVTAAEGRFDAIELRVQRVAVQFHSVTVHFANGEKQEIELRSVIPAGGRSRVIDIEGHDRVIRTVEFWYDAQSLRGRQGVVRLFGRH
jgi:hypothetical protein